MAQAANVSPSTVSRVIKNHPSISKETANLVQIKMAELGYTPNLTARSLITKKTNTIGIILKSASKEVRQNPFYNDVMYGITKECNDKNYATQTTISSSEGELYKEVDSMISTHAVDGFILLFSISNNIIKQLLIEKDVPFVVIGKPLDKKDDDIIHIDNDNIQAGRYICHYLITKNHRNIIFINEVGKYAVNEDRTLGFEKEAQINRINYQIIESENNFNYLKKIIQSYILNQHISLRPTAIICSDSMIHHTLLSVLYFLNIYIPKDISTATFNDSFLTKMAAPPQTTVDIYPVELGSNAADRIIQVLNNNHISKNNIWISTRIIERQSTIINKE